MKTQNQTKNTSRTILRITEQNGFTNVRIKLSNKAIIATVVGVVIFFFPHLWDYFDVLFTLLSLR